MAFDLLALLLFGALGVLLLLWAVTDGRQHEDPIRIASPRLPNVLGDQ